MANVKTRAGVIRNVVGAPLSGKVATLKNEVTGATIGTTVNTDPDGRYTFSNLDETIRYRVEVAFGGGSSQMHVNSPISPDLDHAYVNSSLRSAPAATVAFGGPVSVGGVLTTPGLTVTGQAVIQGNTTISASELAIVSPTSNAIVTINSQAAGTVPMLRFRNQANTGDNAYVDMFVDSGGELHIRAVSDSYGVAPVWMSFRRSGTTLESVAFGATVIMPSASTGPVAVTGTLSVTGLASLNGGIGVTGSSTLNGATNVGGTLTVAGATAINNTLFVNSQTTMAGQLIINAGMDLTVQNGATRLTGVLLHAGGYAYFGDFNTAGVYPLAAHSVAVGWNFTSGGRDATIWNTDVANNHTSGNTSFALRQLLPGDTRNDLLTISAGGRATFKAFNAGAPGLSLVNSAGTHMMGFGINGSNFATMCVLAAHMTGSGGAATRNTWGAAPAAACQRVPIADEFGNHVGWVPVYQ